jgi:hypothetical protein
VQPILRPLQRKISRSKNAAKLWKMKEKLETERIQINEEKRKSLLHECRRVMVNYK